MSNDKKALIWRATLVYVAFFIALFSVIVKTFMIQNEGNAAFFSETKEKIPTRAVEHFPRRGEILDRNLNPLVITISMYDLHMDPTVVDQEVFDKEISDLCAGLSELFPETTAREFENYIRKGRANNKRYLTIKNRATNEQRRRVSELPIFNLGRNKGGLIETKETTLRKRPHGDMLKRTLGYYRIDGRNTISVGLEGAFNQYLAGEPGKEVEQKISSGWKKTGQVLRQPIEGANLITSLDMNIQEVAHSELLRQLKNQGAKNGSVIVMDVKTGFIRAIASLQVDENGEYSEMFNHAIGTKEVPGSTFKLASLMAALEDGKINLDDTVNATGVYQFRGAKLTDSNKYGYGKITIRKAFEKSSNVISKIINTAYRDEPELFLKHLKEFGLTEALGIDIKGEVAPVVHYPGSKGWSGLTLPWMAIGYEFQQTPLQTLAFYNAVANNGVFVKPQFVEQIRRGAQVIKTFKPIVLRKKICSDNTLKLMQECLVGVVKRGTGSDLQSSLFDIAGKTGTAVVLNDNGKFGTGGDKKYQASFCGYFPAKDPIYSCIVVVSAPSKDIYGATVSGTVFTAIANKVYSNTLKYHKAINESKKRTVEPPVSINGNNNDLVTILKKLKVPYRLTSYSEWGATSSKYNKVLLTPMKFNKKVVPNVIGLAARDAVYLIERLGMHVFLRGRGKVVSQSIKAGTEAYRGGLVEIVLE